MVQSATYKCGDAIHLTILLKISLTIGSSLDISEETSKMSSSSERNRVYLVKLAKGQYFKSPSIKG